jgi:hypothetical protein
LPGNRLEALAGDRKGQYSIRVNDQWRICLEDAMAVTAIRPGDHLAEELKELGMSAAGLARKLDVPTNRVTSILNGQRAITGTPPCVWPFSSARVRSSG